MKQGPRVAQGAHNMKIIVNDTHVLFMPIIGLPYSLASQEYREYLSDPLYSDRKHTTCLGFCKDIKTNVLLALSRCLRPLPCVQETLENQVLPEVNDQHNQRRNPQKTDTETVIVRKEKKILTSKTQQTHARIHRMPYFINKYYLYSIIVLSRSLDNMLWCKQLKDLVGLCVFQASKAGRVTMSCFTLLCY